MALKKKIGRTDVADLPELGLEGIPVKVDTGAFSSSLWASAIHERNFRGKKHLYFKAFSPDSPLYTGKTLRFSDYKKKVVKSSSGQSEERYFVQTDIILFDQSYPVTFSLSDRRAMRYPVLLGRRLIRNNFIVDVNRKNLSDKKKKSDG